MIDTLFHQFKIYIKVWLLTYLYMVFFFFFLPKAINGFFFIFFIFMNIILLLSNKYSKKYHNLFWKAIYFGHKFLKIRSKYS